jgi:hypothetical protein
MLLLFLLSLEIEMVLLHLLLLLLQLPAVSFVSNIVPGILIINDEMEATLAHKSWYHPMMSYGGIDQYTTMLNLVYGVYLYTRFSGVFGVSFSALFSNFFFSKPVFDDYYFYYVNLGLITHYTKEQNQSDSIYFVFKIPGFLYLYYGVVRYCKLHQESLSLIDCQVPV